MALSYEKNSGQAAIYLNGQAVAQSNLGSFDPQTGFDLVIGARTTFGSAEQPARAFLGSMNKISIYRRALSAAEIEAVCKADNHGELPPTPTPGSALPFNGSYRNGYGE